MISYPLCVAILVLVLFFCRVYSRFKKYGVKHFTPYPLVGNMTPKKFKQTHIFHHINALYSAFPGEKFVGQYEFLRPVVYLRDLELIKKVTITDFENFVDNRPLINEEADPVYGRIVFYLKGQEWKDMRKTLNPAFTSASVERLFPFMLEVGQQMIASIKRKIRVTGMTFIDLDAKDLVTRYANDIIASCVFGVNVDSIADPNNEFYRQGRIASGFNLKRVVKYIGFCTIPYLMKKMGITFFPREPWIYFEELALRTMRHRGAFGIFRPDMINVLMEAKKGVICHQMGKQETDPVLTEDAAGGDRTIQKAWSDTDLIAQSLVFFLAGYDSAVTCMKFILYELAMNPKVQNKLVQEILDHRKVNDGNFDLNSIQQMVYMDMVVLECLRLWPPGLVFDRTCLKNYDLGKPNNKAPKNYIVKAGESVAVPICSIHRDPKYFPNPGNFDPERFSKENRPKMSPNAFMPFGLGPRSCLGSQFALAEMKLLVYQLLQHMEVMPCKRTRLALEISPSSSSLDIKGGHWLRFKLRS